MFTHQQLRASPNVLAKEYSHSHVSSRILLTGHRHQAMPDCSLQGQQDSWMHAASHIEERWDGVFEKSDDVRAGFARLIDDQPENIALAGSIHDLAMRFISALPLTKRPKLVTTTGEHPSINRTLYRLAEEGFQVVSVPMQPASTVVERLLAEVDDKTSAVFVSSVSFETGHLVLELDRLMPTCEKFGAQLFVDAYQSVNVLSFSIKDYNLEQAFVVGGGTKYCQLGGGVCFMHVPPLCKLRPIITGWFGCFDPVIDNPAALPIVYGDHHQLFEGATFDSTAHFRAAHVFNFFKTHQLTPDFLHDVNHHQLGVLANNFKKIDADRSFIKLSTDVEFMGGFISFDTKYAKEISEHLRDIGIHTDWRKDWLRMGPAPYICDEQLEDAMLALDEVIKKISNKKN